MREYLNTSDEYVSHVLRIAAKALAEAYQSSYDMPKDMGDGWIGVRIGVHPECHMVKPKKDVDEALRRLLDLSKECKQLFNSSK